LFFAQISGSMN